MRTFITRSQRIMLGKMLGSVSPALLDKMLSDAKVAVSISEDPDQIALHELIQVTMQMGVYDALAYCPDDLREAYTFAAEAPEAVLRTICERAADRLSDNAVASSAWRAALDAAVGKAGYPIDRADAGEGCDE